MRRRREDAVMAKRAWMPFYGDDFYGATPHLTAEQRGGYQAILWAMWRSPDGTLANNDRELKRIAGIDPRRWSRAGPAIMEMLTVVGDRITQKRLQVELQYCLKVSATKSEAGRRGAKAHHRDDTLRAPNPLKDNDAPLAYADTLHTSHSKKEYTPTPTASGSLPENQKEGIQKEALVELSVPQPTQRKRPDYPEAFEKFWKEYPSTKNASKSEALAAWVRLSPEDQTAASAGNPGYRSYCRDNAWHSPRHPNRYLKGRLFEAYQPAPRVESAKVVDFHREEPRPEPAPLTQEERDRRIAASAAITAAIRNRRA
jgi:uncharacterized protein YdaU (DUF1376 family)